MASGSGTSTYGQPAYPLSAGEITLGTNPASFAYKADPYIDPRRYGADPTGTYDSTAAIVQALAVGAQDGKFLWNGTNTYSAGTTLNGYPFITLLGTTLYGSSNASTVNVFSLAAPGANNTSTGTGRALMLFGAPNTYTAEITGSATSAQSYGLYVRAGTTASDTALLIREQTGVTNRLLVRGDGAVALGGSTFSSAGGGLTIAAPTSGNALTVNAVSGSAGAQVFAAAGSFASLLLKSGLTGTRSFELVSGNTTDCFDIFDDTLANTRFQINGSTGVISGRGPTTAGLVDMTPDGGTFTGTLTGCTTSPTATCVWSRIGNNVMLWIPALTATSNSTACTITGLPAAIRPSRAQNIPFMILDASVATMGGIQVNAASGTLSLLKNAGGVTGYSATFTNSATTKGSGSGVICYLLN